MITTEHEYNYHRWWVKLIWFTNSNDEKNEKNHSIIQWIKCVLLTIPRVINDIHIMIRTKWTHHQKWIARWSYCKTEEIWKQHSDSWYRFYVVLSSYFSWYLFSWSMHLSWVFCSSWYLSWSFIVCFLIIVIQMIFILFDMFGMVFEFDFTHYACDNAILYFVHL